LPGSHGQEIDLWQVSSEISKRLAAFFLSGKDGRPSLAGSSSNSQNDPHWRDLVLFHEYFHGDNVLVWCEPSKPVDWSRCKLLEQSGE